MNSQGQSSLNNSTAKTDAEFRGELETKLRRYNLKEPLEDPFAPENQEILQLFHNLTQRVQNSQSASDWQNHNRMLLRMIDVCKFIITEQTRDCREAVDELSIRCAELNN